MTTFTARVTRQSGDHGAGWLVFHEVGEVDDCGMPETYRWATYHPDEGETVVLDLPGYALTTMGGRWETTIYGVGESHVFEIHDCRENAEA